MLTRIWFDPLTIYTHAKLPAQLHHYYLNITLIYDMHDKSSKEFLIGTTSTITTECTQITTPKKNLILFVTSKLITRN